MREGEMKRIMFLAICTAAMVASAARELCLYDTLIREYSRMFVEPHKDDWIRVYASPKSNIYIRSLKPNIFDLRRKQITNG
jgi:hypothetical protein